MALVLKTLYNGYHQYFYENQDPRSADFILMNPPWLAFALIAGYLYFVRNLGPKIMAHRKPFDLKWLIQIYNILQVLANIYILWKGLEVAYDTRMSFTCQPVNYSNDLIALRELRLVHLYYVLKVSDFLDTIFFILRKKHSHVSFLHVYHHCGVMIGSYLCCRFFPGGHFAMLGFWNTFVHAVMYSYFFLTVTRPELTKNASWKRYITLLQMVQFGYLVWHFAAPIVLGIECGIPRFVLLMPLIQNMFMLALFWDFYYKSYGTRKVK